jgi:hypothetical protein
VEIWKFVNYIEIIMIYYILYLIFIWMNLYYLSNISKLNTRLSDRKSITKLDYLYYITRFLFWVFIIFGLFTQQVVIFTFIILLSFFKFILYHINYNLYKLYVILLHITLISILGYLLLQL